MSAKGIGAKAQIRAKSRRNKATKAQSREESCNKAAQRHEGTKPHREDAKKTANKAAQSRASQMNRAKVKTREEPRGIAQIAMKVLVEQEPKEPSLRHKLKGENNPRRAAHQESCEESCPSRATERSRATKTRRNPRNAAKKLQAAPMRMKLKETKLNVGCLTLEFEGAC